ncbi:hypothetical protein MKW94_013345 [Papaver nudicaule]|uniref:Uncharacterized protein n=1 Tax=Papaver nudicaule TaxID=74823 RepID=A0AA41VRR4_PAPNU|nr:hypothetical protein [Papaver nudicaule]
MNKGERVFIPNGKVNGVIIKFGNQIKEEKHVNWRFTTDLKIKINQVHRVEKEIYMIFEEDKDLEQEDAFRKNLKIWGLKPSTKQINNIFNSCT